MKKFFIILSVLFLFSCANEETNSTQTDATTDTTTVAFEVSEFDFGTIEQGEQVTYTYKFKNTGKSPLIIQDVRTSCGCTVPSYSDKPVGPGSEGFLKIRFNSAGKHGNQYKLITVTSNTKPEKTELIIKGNVNVPE